MRAATALLALALALALAGAAGEPPDPFLEALARYRAGELVEAAARLETLLARDPGHAPARALLGWSRLRLGDPEAAGRAFERALELEPGAPDPACGLGYVALREGRPADAEIWFRRALQGAPESADAFKGLGLAARALDRPRDALADFERAAALAPGDGETRELLERARAALAVERRLAPPVPAGKPPRVDVRARSGRFELREGDAWRAIQVAGVNLGTALPGRFPAEFPDDPALYRTWFDLMSEMGANVVRLYTLHPPSLYRALAEHNARRPERPLRLVQGVWTELPPDDDFEQPAFAAAFRAEIERVIDAVHGNLELPPRPGHASGRYETDLSPWLLAWLIGREWEPYAVEAFDAAHPEPRKFGGRYVRTTTATATEVWLASMLDAAVAHETEYYGRQVPVAFVSWPTLDPLHHPTESTHAEERAFRGDVSDLITREGRWHDEDAVAVDATRLTATPGFAAGVYASYHAYPYYPDFMNLDPGYAEARDAEGVSRYLGYLRDLARHHGEQPVLIAELGVPSSRGVAHLQPERQHHGGHTTEEQGRIDARLLRNVREAGLAGGILFAWIDEWFKRNWAVYNREVPPERNPLWLNVMDPEQNFGLLAAWPGEHGSKVVLDGRDDDWRGLAPLAGADDDGRLRALRATSDEAYLYLRIELAGVPLFSRPERLWIGIDTHGAELGDRSFPPPSREKSPVGLEYLLELEDGSGWLLIDPPYRIFEGSFGRPCASEPNDDGLFEPITAVPNRERWGRDGIYYPARTIEIGRLRHGTTDPASPAYDSLADWFLAPDGRSVEIRLPWGLLNVTDPSSRRVIQETTRTEGLVETEVTDGFRFVVRLVETNDDRLEVTGRLPRDPAAEPALYAWPTWERPTWHLVPKASYFALREALRSP